MQADLHIMFVWSVCIRIFFEFVNEQFSICRVEHLYVSVYHALKWNVCVHTTDYHTQSH